jgi:hypothetical protein
VSFFFDDVSADSRDLLEACLNSQELAELVLDSPLRPVSLLVFNVANYAHCECTLRHYGFALITLFLRRA